MHIMAAVDICTKDYEAIWNIVGLVINIIKIGIPIVLILFGMIDLSKAVISGKEDEQKKATKLLGKRFLYAVGVFASVWIVTLVLDLVAGVFENEKDTYEYNEASWKKCWALINGNSTDDACYLCNNKTYKWGNYSGNSECKLKSDIKTPSRCTNSSTEKKCYKFEIDGMEPTYVWESGDLSRQAGYTLVSGVSSKKDCLKKNK